MKSFLAICTCAMVAAGIYGFTDMAIDVKNGTMIQYDHGDGETDDLSPDVMDEKIQDKKAGQKVQLAEEKAVQKESTTTTKTKTKKKVVKKKEPVVVEAPIQETVVIEEFATAVKKDSVPQIIEREDKYDYREFSRGAPREYKKNKKSKKIRKE